VAYFFSDIISFHGLMSEGSKGLPRILLARVVLDIFGNGCPLCQGLC